MADPNDDGNLDSKLIYVFLLAWLGLLLYAYINSGA